jgi:hypothetical protein
MKLLKNIPAVATALFTLNAPLASGADPVFDISLTPMPARYGDLVQRAESALTQYAQDCATNVSRGSGSLTETAVIEYATDKAGVFLASDAASLEHCWEGAQQLTQAVNSHVRLYPTSYLNTVFIQFETEDSTDAAHLCIAIVEMDGARISRIRDLTTVKAL